MQGHPRVALFCARLLDGDYSSKQLTTTLNRTMPASRIPHPSLVLILALSLPQDLARP
ncbi:hypothetical protein [Onishia taeanensis]|uniref:hypothetical protein n=1 Tax=Onishia taeanensis TaxID=284577 RepID=UPI003C7B1938